MFVYKHSRRGPASQQAWKVGGGGEGIKEKIGLSTAPLEVSQEKWADGDSNVF